MKSCVSIFLLKSLCRVVYVAVLLFASLTMVFAQNPVPQIVGPAEPDAVAPGSGPFTLTVYGANFVPGAVVNWNRQPRSTTFVSSDELQAEILASDVAQNTAGYISVTNPPPGGGESSASWTQVEVHTPTSTIAVNPPIYYGAGGWFTMLADFNNDNIPDFVGEYYQTLPLYLGEGNGNFQFSSIAGRAGYEGTTGAYGDFNGDGNLDFIFLAGGVRGGPTQATLMLGNGAGQFSVGSYIRANAVFSDLLAVGDFNRDGKLDLVTSIGVTQRLSIYVGNGDGTFQTPSVIEKSIRDVQGIAVGDFNGDGNLDLVLVQYAGNQIITVYVLFGKGDGTFDYPQVVSSISDAIPCISRQYLTVSDFNGDGKPDVAFCTMSQIGILLGKSDGKFGEPVYTTVDTKADGLFNFTTGDFNSDGKSDLMVSEFGSSSQFSVLFGNGDGTFQSPVIMDSVQGAGEEGIQARDLNLDGLLDFVYQTGAGIAIYTQQ